MLKFTASKSDNMSLHDCVKQYKFRNAIPGLIERGVDINATDKHGNTALHIACIERCESDVIKCLIGNRAAVNILNDAGQTPLEIACVMGHYELLPSLINGGADINRIIDADGNTILHKVFMDLKQETITPIQELLVRKGANLDTKNNHGKSPLDLAIETSNWLKVEWQLNAGRKLKWLSESQLRLATTHNTSAAMTPLLNDTVRYQLKVFGKYFAYKIANNYPQMPVELIRKQLHFLWGDDKYFDDVIDDVVSSFTKNYRPNAYFSG